MSMRPLRERTCPRAAGFGAYRIVDKSAPTVPCELRPPVVDPGASHAASQRGMTLVELILTIVIIGIAATALFSAMASITARSADPMLRQQSLAIAEGYLDEILLQDYDNPDPNPCPGRRCFNDVRDYHGLNDNPPRDLNGDVIPGLNNYRVVVTVSETTGADGLGPAGAKVDALHVRVTVTDPARATLILDGWRTNYD